MKDERKAHLLQRYLSASAPDLVIFCFSYHLERDHQYHLLDALIRLINPLWTDDARSLEWRLCCSTFFRLNDLYNHITNDGLSVNCEMKEETMLAFFGNEDHRAPIEARLATCLPVQPLRGIVLGYAIMPKSTCMVDFFYRRINREQQEFVLDSFLLASTRIL